MQTRAISVHAIHTILYKYFNQSNIDEYGEMDWSKYVSIVDILVGENNQLICFYKIDGVYYQSNISIVDDLIELSNVQEVFDRASPQIRITKQSNGKYRWFGIVGASVLNRIGVFDSKALFDDLVKNFNDIPLTANSFDLPFTTLVHVGEKINLGTVDKLERYENLLLASGEFNDSDYAIRTRNLIEKNPDYVGYSIGFWSNSETITKSNDEKLRAMYTKGRLKEISFLPEKYSAHPLTKSFNLSKEENRMALPNEQALREMLSTMGYDNTKIEDIVNGANTANRVIEENNMEVRVKEEEPVIEAQPQEKEITQPTPDVQDLEIELSEELVRSIQSEIEANLNTTLVALQERISTLEAHNAELQKSVEGLQNRVVGVEKDVTEQVQEIVQDLPAKAKQKVKVVTRARSLVDEKNPVTNVLPDVTKEGWAKNLATATRNKN